MYNEIQWKLQYHEIVTWYGNEVNLCKFFVWELNFPEVFNYVIMKLVSAGFNAIKEAPGKII